MLKSTASKQIRAGRPAALVVALFAVVVAALLAATPAWASSPSDVSLRFYKYNPKCGCAQEATTVRAGEQVGYKVSFTATSALSGGSAANDSITISAPSGTVFPAGGYSLDNDTTETGYNLPNTNVVLSDGGSTVTIPLAGNDAIAIGAGDRVSVSIGLLRPPFVTNPDAPGEYTLDVRTSSDTTPATSNPYTIAPKLFTNPPGPGGVEECTITGDNGDNVLRGTDRRDVICARGGADTVSGLGGNDVIMGGDGRDTIRGGDGNDFIHGNKGRDRLYGNAGKDTIYSGAGRDFVRGGTGRDVRR